MKQNKQQEEFDPTNVKVHRSREGTLFEVVSILMMAVTWVIALTRHQTIEQPFNDLGMLGAWTIVGIVLLVVAYAPRFISTGQELSNIKQVSHAIRMCRVIALEMALLALTMTVITIKPVLELLWKLFPAVICLTVIIFSVLIYKAK